jgi:hypothetical protein
MTLSILDGSNLSASSDFSSTMCPYLRLGLALISGLTTHVLAVAAAAASSVASQVRLPPEPQIVLAVLWAFSQAWLVGDRAGFGGGERWAAGRRNGRLFQALSGRGRSRSALHAARCTLHAARCMLHAARCTLRQRQRQRQRLRLRMPSGQCPPQLRRRPHLAAERARPTPRGRPSARRALKTPPPTRRSAEAPCRFPAVHTQGNLVMRGRAGGWGAAARRDALAGEAQPPLGCSARRVRAEPTSAACPRTGRAAERNRKSSQR